MRKSHYFLCESKCRSQPICLVLHPSVLELTLWSSLFYLILDLNSEWTNQRNFSFRHNICWLKLFIAFFLYETWIRQLNYYYFKSIVNVISLTNIVLQIIRTQIVFQFLPCSFLYIKRFCTPVKNFLLSYQNIFIKNRLQATSSVFIAVLLYYLTNHSTSRENNLAMWNIIAERKYLK